MATYKQVFGIDGLINPNIIKRVDDGAFIPNDAGNRDWAQFQLFLKSGGIPLPADVVVISPQAQARIQAEQKLKDPLATDQEKLNALIILVG